MKPPVRVKICGLTVADQVLAAVDAGAAYVGFVFFPRSPRHLAPQTARAIALDVPPGIAKVGLFVNPDNQQLEEVLSVVPLDMIQLHGQETPARVSEVRSVTGLPVMKAVGVAGAEDIARIAEYEAVADQILVDAKPPEGAALPGGNGISFDWQLLADRKEWKRPWMLAGGLTPENVAVAIQLTGARQVDVSSGVERAPGVKDSSAIRRFIAAAGAGPVSTG